jgi:hypothetical protein
MQRLDQYGNPDDRAGCYYKRGDVIKLVQMAITELKFQAHYSSNPDMATQMFAVIDSLMREVE